MRTLGVRPDLLFACAVFCAAHAACGPSTSAPSDAATTEDTVLPSPDEGTPPSDAALDAATDATPPPGDTSTDVTQPPSDGSADAGPAPSPLERATITRRTDPCIASPTDFGAYGTVTQYDRYEVSNPSWVGSGGPLAVQVLAPVGGAPMHPVLFYSHPFGGSDWTRVRSLLEFLVSHDYVVVFTPYATADATVCQRYDTLWTGHQRAVDVLGSALAMDTTRVGFIGHSFGGGANPWLVHEAVVTRRWGANGLFFHANAPWYTHRMDAASWAQIPATARLHVMVFRDDDTNDHRIAIADQWEPFAGVKQYVELVSDTNGSCTQTADHLVPATDSTMTDAVRFNGLDTWGVWRHAQALAACTLRGQATACSVIDGSDPARETAMGTWTASGTPVAPAVRMATPVPANPASAYTFNLTRRALFPCEGRGGG